MVAITQGNWNSQYDNISLNGATHVWIDHNAFSDGDHPDAKQPTYLGRPYQVHDGAIDIEPMVRDAVLLSMPFSPLCKPDCAGLCPRCGGDRNLGECTCGPELADERWSVLNEIRFDG